MNIKKKSLSIDKPVFPELPVRMRQLEDNQKDSGWRST